MIYKSQPVDFIMYKNGEQGPAGQGLSGQYDFYAATNSMFNTPTFPLESDDQNFDTDIYTKDAFFGTTNQKGHWDIRNKSNNNEINPVYDYPYVWKATYIKTSVEPIKYILAAGPVLLSDLEAATMAAAVQIIDTNDIGKDKIYLSIVGKWCRLAGKTIIDGSTIVTGSIGADQINTSRLSAEYILVKDENDEILFEVDGRESADPQNGSKSKVYAKELSTISANVGILTAGVIKGGEYGSIEEW